ncbi:MAG: PQQ-dependent sugar dehydrogenase [Pseudomonadota bacterium]
MAPRAVAAPGAIKIAPTPVVEDLNRPWSVAFLPDGGFLITEKRGTLNRVSASGERIALKGLPDIAPVGQGGLLDVALHPGFADNGWVYLTYSGRGRGGVNTELARGRLDGDRLEDTEVLFQATPKLSGGAHFGSRLLFHDDGTLYMTLGERYRLDGAQDPSNHLGAVVRLMDDGSIPSDNPFRDDPSIRPEIFSYGHRNMQGIARHPVTGAVWTHEHGPQGGDEINILKAGANYGWPLVTYGIDYDGSVISSRTEAPGIEPPLHHWTPSIAPCGMAFYTGDAIPEWTGSLFVGALKERRLHRLTVTETAVTGEEILLEELSSRIRDVRSAPDGHLYVLTDDSDGALFRLDPA